MQSDEEYSTPPEFEEEAKEILVLKMLPAKSKARYEQAYNSFVAWQKQTGKTTFTESVFILYFHEKSKTMSPTSLWSIYSMLRTTCELNNNVNIANFKKMKKILRKHSLGYISKKSKVFTPEDLNKFIQEAPDTEHLSNKVNIFILFIRKSKVMSVALYTKNHNSYFLLLYFNIVFLF